MLKVAENPLNAAPSSSGTSSPGTAVIIIGGAVVLGIAGGLLLWARAAQRHYFRELERIRGIKVDDPQVWEMEWSDIFRRRPDYWAAMLNDPEEPELRALRRTTLKRAGLAAAAVIVGFIVVVQLGNIVGYR